MGHINELIGEHFQWWGIFFPLNFFAKSGPADFHIVHMYNYSSSITTYVCYNTFC